MILLTMFFVMEYFFFHKTRTSSLKIIEKLFFQEHSACINVISTKTNTIFLKTFHSIIIRKTVNKSRNTKLRFITSHSK